MKNHTAFIRMGSFLLALCMIFTLVPPVYAAEDQLLSSGDFAFTQTVKNGITQEQWEGNFFKDDQKLYIDAETILGFAEVNGKKEGENYRSFSRTDNNSVEAVFDTSKYKTVTFEGVTYYPYTDVMADLCISTAYDQKNQVVNLTGAMSIEELSDELSGMNNNPIYNNANYRKSLLNHEVSNVIANGMDIANNFFVKPGLLVSKVTGVDSYERYRDVIWKILIPDDDAFYDYKELADGKDTHLSALSYIVNESTELWETTVDMSKKLDGLGKFIDIAGNVDTFLQLNDMVECYKFYYSIDKMSQSLGNGMALIRDSSPAYGDQMTRAIEDTANIYDKTDSLSDLIMKQLEQGGVEVVASMESGDIRYQLYKDLLNFTYGTSDQTETTMEVYANLLLQDKADSSFHFYQNSYEASDDRQKKTTALKNMRDIMAVYLMAGYNSYNAGSLSGDKSLLKMQKELVKEVMGIGLAEDRALKGTLELIKEEYDYLMSFADMDFTVYEDAFSTQSSILANVSNRGETHYKFTWNPAAAGKMEAVLEGVDEKGIAFRHKFNFSDYYYLSNGMQAAQLWEVNNSTGSVYVKVYDFEGSCALILRPASGGGSLKDIDLKAMVGGSYRDDFCPEDFLSGGCYRIPLPFEGKTEEEPTVPAPTEPKAPVAQELPKAADNQFLFSTVYADYLITYDADVFTYGNKYNNISLDVVNKGSEKYTAAEINVSNAQVNFDLFHRETWAGYNPKNNSGEYVGKSVSQTEELTLNNGMTVKYFDVTSVSGKVEDSPVFTSRYFYIEMGNGESFSCHDYYYQKREAIHGLSYEDYLKRAFLNIEIFPKEDAPQIYGQESMLLYGEKGTYKLTCDPSAVLLYADNFSDLYFTYSKGVDGELDGNVRSSGYLNSEYSSFDDFVSKRKDYFTNTFKKAQNVSFGEPGEFAVGDFMVRYLPVTYYNAARDLQFTEVLNFYVDMGNGEALTGNEQTTALFGSEIGYSGDSFLKKAFVDLEIVK